MKTIYLLALTVGLLMSGCARDKGNYDYTPIDKITIEGIKSSYTSEYRNKLSIPVTLIHTLETEDSDLKFQWEFNGTVVSEDKDLNIELVEALNFGGNDCRYTVIDTRNGMKHYYRFKLNIVSSFNWGYYFLTEKADHSTVLSYLKATPDEEERKNLEFAHTTGIGEYKFGNNPRAIAGYFQNFSALKGEYWGIKILTHDGEYPVIQTENSTFMPNMLINSGRFVDQKMGYTFNPDDILINRDRKNFYFISDGKLILYTGGILYRPAKHNKNYNWSNPVLADTNTSIFVFDSGTQKYYAIKPQSTDPVQGIIGDRYAYDKVLEITFPGAQDPPKFEGHRILGAYASGLIKIGDTDDLDVIHVASADANGFYITDLNMLNYGETSIKKDQYRTILPGIPGIDDNSQAFMLKMDWYVSAGNTIYTSPELSPVFTKLIELPASLGTITYMAPSARGTTLVVTTYNASSDAEKKGSVILVDIKTQSTLIYENVIERCVSLLSANTHPRGGVIGDEK